MPITQTRMLALIAAADDFQRGIERAQGIVKAAAQAASLNRDEALPILQSLPFELALPALLSYPTETITTIAVEREHFRVTKGRNEAAARWQANKRGSATPRPRRELDLQPSMPSITRPPPARPRPTILDINSDFDSDDNYDESQVESKFAISDLDLSLDLDRAAAAIKRQPAEPISPLEQRRLDIEIANLNHAPAHSSRVRAGATSADDLLTCSCGFVGPVEAWKEHIADLDASKAAGGLSE